MNEFNADKPLSEEQKQRNLDEIGAAIQRAKIIQDVEKMPKPPAESERPTADDPAVWDLEPDGTLKKAA